MSALTPTDTSTICSTCGARAAADQRYCLSCGVRREEVPDPVSRYLGEASAARARVAAATARVAQARSSRRLPAISPVIATVLVVVALLVGLEIGHSSAGSVNRPVQTTSARSATSTASGSGDAVDKVVKSSGKGYVQQQKSLPTSVTP
jgi:hypothetical protein